MEKLLPEKSGKWVRAGLLALAAFFGEVFEPVSQIFRLLAGLF